MHGRHHDERKRNADSDDRYRETPPRRSLRRCRRRGGRRRRWARLSGHGSSRNSINPDNFLRGQAVSPAIPRRNGFQSQRSTRIGSHRRSPDARARPSYSEGPKPRKSPPNLTPAKRRVSPNQLARLPRQRFPYAMCRRRCATRSRRRDDILLVSGRIRRAVTRIPHWWITCGFEIDRRCWARGA